MSLLNLGFSGGSKVKNLPPSAGDTGSIPGLGRSSGEGNDNPLQYSCLGNPMDRETWQAVVHRVAKSWTLLSDFSSLTSYFITGEGNGNPLQYSCLGNPMDKGASQTTV